MSENYCLLLSIKIAFNDLKLFGFSEDSRGFEDHVYMGQLLCNARHINTQQSCGTSNRRAGLRLCEDNLSWLCSGIKMYNVSVTIISHLFSLRLFFQQKVLGKLHLVLFCQGKSLSSTGNHF